MRAWYIAIFFAVFSLYLVTSSREPRCSTRVERNSIARPLRTSSSIVCEIPSLSLSSSADILPDAQHLRIRLHSLANPRSNQALAHVCATLNALQLQYPGTTLRVVYEAPGVA